MDLPHPSHPMDTAEFEVIRAETLAHLKRITFAALESPSTDIEDHREVFNASEH